MTADNVQDKVHLIERQSLRLRQEKVSPRRGDEHPRGKEVPCSESERAEDIWKSFGDGKLNSPLHKSGPCATEHSESTRKDFGANNPWDTIQTKGPAWNLSASISFESLVRDLQDRVDHNHSCGCFTA